MSTKQRSRRTAEEWSRIIAAWRASGETSKVFAARHSLNAGTLLYWSYRVGKEPQAPRPARKARTAPDFMQVQIADRPMRPQPGTNVESRAGGSMEVVTRGGRVIRWEGPMDPEAFRVMLKVVESC